MSRAARQVRPRRQHVRLVKSDFGEQGFLDRTWGRTKDVWRKAQTARFWTGATIAPPVPDGVLYGAGALVAWKVASSLFGGGGMNLLIGAWNNAKNLAFAAALPSSEVAFFQNKTGLDLATFILQMSQQTGVSPAVIYGLGHLESGWGTQLASDMTGDDGHGHGYLQIDDRTWGDWLAANNWEDPTTNVTKGLSILTDDWNSLSSKFAQLSPTQLIQLAAASFNAGPGRVATAVSKALSAGTDPVAAANAVTTQMEGEGYITHFDSGAANVGGYA